MQRKVFSKLPFVAMTTNFKTFLNTCSQFYLFLSSFDVFTVTVREVIDYTLVDYEEQVQGAH